MHLVHSVVRHEQQEGGQVGELEPHERALQEAVITPVGVVAVAVEGHWSLNEGERRRAAKF